MRRIIACLILGVVTTIAVAWGSTLLVDLSVNPDTSRRAIVLEAPGRSWIGATQDRPTASLVISYRQRMAGVNRVRADRFVPEQLIPHWTGFYSEPPEFAHPGCDLVVEMADRRGWPLYALWSGPIRDVRTSGVWVSSGPDDGIDVGLDPTKMFYGHQAGRELPLRPIWWGLVGNSAIFGVLWFPLLNWRAVRTHRRRARGHCPHCAYDLRHDLAHGCPECGWNREREGIEGSRHRGIDGSMNQMTEEPGDDAGRRNG